MFMGSFFLVRTLASWQSPLTRRYSIEFSESSIRAFQCYVPQLTVVADMTRRSLGWGERNLKPEAAAGTAALVGIPKCYWST